jgi:DNA-binding CsgD family transcriptional regulator
VHGIQAPVWINTAQGQIHFINDSACSLFGIRSREALNLPCHALVCGRDGTGRAYCSSECPVRRAVRNGLPIAPASLQIGSGSVSHWVHLLVIKTENGDGKPSLVHCALPDDRGKRVEEYLSRVMLRSPTAGVQYAQLIEARLSQREWEVLRLLAEDESLHGIALRLRISYTTVRNHVQHALGKLGLHSIMEAVAFYLLTADEFPEAPWASPNSLRGKARQN